MRTNIDLYTETIQCLKQIVEATVALSITGYITQSISELPLNVDSTKIKQTLPELPLKANSTKKTLVKKNIRKQKKKALKRPVIRVSDRFHVKFLTTRFNYHIKINSRKLVKNVTKPIEFDILNLTTFSFSKKMFSPTKSSIVDLFSSMQISGIFRLNILDLMRLFLFYVLYLKKKNKTLKEQEKLRASIFFPLYKINLQIAFIFLNKIEIGISLEPTEPKEIEFKHEEKEETTNLIQEESHDKKEEEVESEINEHNSDFVFKVPFNVIEPNQDFLPIASAQPFSFLNESNYDLIKTQILSQTIQDEAEYTLEINFVETQILEQNEKVIKPRIELQSEFQQIKPPKLEKRKSTEKIKERIFMNFSPFYNSVNSPVFKPTIYSSQIEPTQVFNHRIATQATQNIEQMQSKTTKKRSFMKIGLSKKQKIKKHLHDI